MSYKRKCPKHNSITAVYTLVLISQQEKKIQYIVFLMNRSLINLVITINTYGTRTMYMNN